MTMVVGMDACKRGWVAVALRDGAFAEAREIALAKEALTLWPDLAVLAIDIPIGLPDRDLPYPREADVQAARFVGRRRSSVFPSVPLEVLRAATWADAADRMRGLYGIGLSRQSYGLRAKVLEVNDLAIADDRIHEVHPEVSFRAMAGEASGALDSKKTWNGLMQRRRLLEREGIEVPESLPEVPTAASDDVLDAAAAAWSAWRIATGAARTLPDPPQSGASIKRIAIHY
jgi:predicted RNase H-like nuclease